MKKNYLKIWRGIITICLSLALALVNLTSITETWRSVIDQTFGTTSVKSTKGDKFVSVYKTTDELVSAHVDLGKRVAEEGAVLLKNDNNTLPLASEKLKVTLFGMGSMYPFLGGTMGSSITGEDQIDLVTALEDKEIEVNPIMTEIYQTFGKIVTGEVEGWEGKSPVYGHRPANFSTPYEPSEPALNLYTKSKEDGGAGAAANHVDSFKKYNDAAIVVFSRPGAEGSDYYPGAEGIDQEKYGAKNSLGLTTNERDILQLAKENFEKVIVLINSGSTMEIEELKQDSEVDSIMYIGYPGAYGFMGIVDLLDGTSTPSGYLADTYAVDITQSPAAQNFGQIEIDDLKPITYPDSLMGDLAATSPLGSFGGEASMAANHYLIEAEGIYIGYKYYETRYYDSILGNGNASSVKGASNDAKEWNYENEVTYTFGQGLSYTTFEQTLENLEILTEDKLIKAEVVVENTGEFAGKSAAQLYAQTPYTEHDQKNGIEKSAIEFLGMEKTKVLAPGEKESLTIVVDMQYLSSWDSTAKDGKGGYILDGGDYYFTIGTGAHEAVDNILAAQGHGKTGNKELVSVKEIGKKNQVDDKTFAKAKNGTEVVNQLANADINYYKPGYATYLSRSDWEGTFPETYNDLTIDGEKLDEWVKNLTNEVYQMAKDGDVELKGSGGSLLLSDLSGVDFEDVRWEQLVEQIPVDTLIAKIVKGGSVSDIIEEIESPLVYQNDGPNGFSGTLSGRGLNLDDKHADYTMATMANEVLLASTFNKELLLEWGELIGNDGLWSDNLLIWGIAANVHRTPFNGRNFEYYSEDAMLSNYMATATVKGALNYGVMIGPKHFAFNDQETQRSGVAPYMTEQKAREGDLRAFQGAFEDGGALAAMTSFSRIGATPVNGSDSLLRSILRDEWGFKGILSTDMVNNVGYFRPEMAIASGITMMADFSTGETMKQVVESWPYFNIDLIAKDPQLVAMAKENMKYQLYAFSQSAAQNIKTEKVTPWWETGMTIIKYSGFVLSLVFAGVYVVNFVKLRGGKEDGIR